jgi:hypothetical protein
MKNNILIRKIAHQIILLTLVTLSACSSETIVSGQVFTTESKTTTKHAQVTIQVYDESTALDQLKLLTKSFEPHCQQAADQYIQAREQYFATAKRAKETLKQAETAINLAEINKTLSSNSSSLETSNKLGESGTKLASTTAQFLRATRLNFVKASANLRGIANGAASEFYFQAFSKAPRAIAISDADGKFQFKIDTGKPYLIAAKRDDMYWLIWHSASEGGQPVYLTEKNMNGTECPECLFSANEMKGRLIFIKQALQSCKPISNGEEIPVGDTSPAWLYEGKPPVDGNFLKLIDVCRVELTKKEDYQKISITPKGCKEADLRIIPNEVFAVAPRAFSQIHIRTESFSENNFSWANLTSDLTNKDSIDTLTKIGNVFPAVYKSINDGRVRITYTSHLGCKYTLDYYFEGRTLYREEMGAHCPSHPAFEKAAEDRKNTLPKELTYSKR